MKITLVITDSKEKNLVFSTDTFKAYSLEEAVLLAKQKVLESVHSVKTGRGSYLRAHPNTSEGDNLDHLSISSYKLFAALDDIKLLLSEPGMKLYWKHLKNHWQQIEEAGEDVIYIEGYPRVTKEQILTKLTPYRQSIVSIADLFSIDPYTLGALVIDEIARANNWEEILDKLGVVFVGINTSAGIAQVKVETARGLIRDGYYNPNPRDQQLSNDKITKVSRRYLYSYIVQPKHSISFSAARVRFLIDRWAPFADISHRPEIIGTLYSAKDSQKPPHPGPKPNERGLQISQEFYPLARSIIGSP